MNTFWTTFAAFGGISGIVALLGAVASWVRKDEKVNQLSTQLAHLQVANLQHLNDDRQFHQNLSDSVHQIALAVARLEAHIKLNGSLQNK